MSEEPIKKMRIVQIGNPDDWWDAQEDTPPGRTLHFDGECWVWAPARSGGDFMSEWLSSLEQATVREFCRVHSPSRIGRGTGLFKLEKAKAGD